MDIISIAQQAKPKPSGQIELRRAQFTALSSVVKIMPSSSSSLPKSSGLVSVTCLPNDVLMFPQSYFGTDPLPRQTTWVGLRSPLSTSLVPLLFFQPLQLVFKPAQFCLLDP